MPVALIMGSMVPDLPYFLDIPVTAESWYEPFVNATFSHSLQGLLLVGLPSVVLLGLLFQLIRRPVGDLLPVHLRFKVFERAQKRSWFSFSIWFLISALIGIATHYLWDSLTETDILSGRLLQHASTVLGIIVIVLWGIRSFRAREVTIERVTVSRSWGMKRVAIILSMFLVSAGVAVFSVVQVQDRDGPLGLELTLSLLVKSGLRIAVVAVVVYALIWYGYVWYAARFSKKVKVS